MDVLFNFSTYRHKEGMLDFLWTLKVPKYAVIVDAKAGLMNRGIQIAIFVLVVALPPTVDSSSAGASTISDPFAWTMLPLAALWLVAQALMILRFYVHHRIKITQRVDKHTWIDDAPVRLCPAAT